MGCPDSLIVKCPECNADIEFQSKADERGSLQTYSLEACPSSILQDLNGEFQECEYCGYVATIRMQTIARVE